MRAADIDGADQLWVLIGAGSDSQEPQLVQVDLATYAGSPVYPLDGENYLFYSLTITWPAPATTGLPGTGADGAPTAIAVIAALVAVAAGVGVLARRRTRAAD